MDLQRVATAFGLIIQNLLIEEEDVSKRAKATTESDATTTGAGTRSPHLDRLTLGLLLREAGALYSRAIHLAVAQMLIPLLTKQVEEEEEAMRGEVVRDLKNEKRECIEEKLVRVLSSLCHLPNEDESAGRATSSSTALSPSTSSSFFARQDVCRLLAAADCLVSSIESQQLSNVWLQAPLLRGEDIKQLLTKIPKGPVFGEIMKEQVIITMRIYTLKYIYTCMQHTHTHTQIKHTHTKHHVLTQPLLPRASKKQVRWMLRYPNGHVDELKQHLTEMYKSCV